MRNVRPLSVAVALSLATASASVVACSGAEPSPQTSASASAATKAPVAEAAHGPVKLVGEALSDVPLRPDQRASIEKLAAEADARHVALASQGAGVATALADQIERGAIDRAALEPLLAKARDAMKDAHAKDAADLEKLHALLDGGQRDAFADALEDKLHGRHRGKHGGFGKLKELADAMGLTDAQRSQIKDVMKSAHAAKAGEGRPGLHRGPHGERGHGHRPKEVLEAFRGEEFDADALMPNGGPGARPHPGMGRMLDTAERILPILMPEQRKIAAERIRAAVAAGEMPFAR